MKIKDLFEKKPTEITKAVPVPSSDGRSENDARCKIKDCAVELFARFGLEGTSTRDIAKASKLNLSLISYYFGGKEGLYRTLFTEFATEASNELGALLSQNDLSSLDQEGFSRTMKNLIERMVLMQIKNPNMMVLMQREELEGLPHAREVWESVFHTLGERIVSVFELASQRKFIRADLNFQFHFLAMVNAIEGAFVASRCRGPWEHKLYKIPDDAHKITNQIYTVFIEGIKI